MITQLCRAGGPELTRLTNAARIHSSAYIVRAFVSTQPSLLAYASIPVQHVFTLSAIRFELFIHRVPSGANPFSALRSPQSSHAVCRSQNVADCLLSSRLLVERTIDAAGCDCGDAAELKP